MAASTAVQNPSVQADSKSAKKRKAKTTERTESPAPVSPLDKTEAGQEDAFESPYIRELQKNIRNVNKKLANTAKTDSIIAEHKDKSLDDLVAQKIINADQKAQQLKKPALQSQLAQLEEQLAQFKKVDAEYKAKLAAEKAEFEKTLTEKLGREKMDAVNEAKESTQSTHGKALRDNLLLISQFLRLAAARRAEEADQTVDENQALEGVLLAVYGGDERAVDTMIKLVEGSEEKTYNTSFEPLQTTFAQVKIAAQGHKVALTNEGQAPETETSTTEAPASDPTIAHAGLTEIEAGDAELSNGHTAEPTTNGTANADVADNAANAAGESQWDAGNDQSMSLSQEWVDVSVPRDPAETETGLNATPAAVAPTASWADDHPEAPVEQPTAVDPNDGFHQVQGRSRGRGNHEGGWGGRGRGRGEWRGRGGYRGEGRGRGRGGPRGGMAMRGARRNEESS